MQTKTKHSYWKDTWRLFRKNRSGMVGLVIVFLLFFTAIFAPFLAGEKPIILVEKGTLYFPAVFSYDKFNKTDWQSYRKANKYDFILMPLVSKSPYRQNLDKILVSPNSSHLFGTDNLGRDILARVIHGSKIALSVGFVAMGIAALIGISLGALAGYYGGATDMVVSRFIEVIICFPLLFLILTVLAFLPPSIYNIMIVIGITGWTGIARLIRGEILKVKGMEYITAAKMLGYKHPRILLRHILPNTIAPVLVSISFGIAGSILTETALSFLGLGVQPPTASWGQILSLARQHPDNTFLAIFPGLAIFIAVTGYNMVGEALRDALDPRLRFQQNN